jgi:hypothetical protein
LHWRLRSIGTTLQGQSWDKIVVSEPNKKLDLFWKMETSNPRLG